MTWQHGAVCFHLCRAQGSAGSPRPGLVARESEKEGGSRDTLAEGKVSVEVTDTHQCTETQKRHSEGHRDREENGRVRRVPFR